ncbi:predicted protein [Sclerotinia sclerotiorum 1980 UF-70]|uniref:GAF domain-containing protein n=1 Tax=Sclerotinia sclerotiorum (strain ATCC 18683 / 1980 / Ss-1) TaxID=665079 RepID=A7ERD1_SCLS1|nr:predicted protein [Sclerotinia sclerotiorum 1980 UF-70]EDN92023.1 predicted protein [Sclerotinia sclerotiorum 1980 UF-70]
MLGVGPMTYQAIPRPKKPKSHARGATIPGSPTPGPFQTQTAPASQSSGFGGFVNAQVHQFPQSPPLPSSPSLQTTSSFDSSNFHTGLSDTSAGTKKSGGFFRLFKKDSRSDGARSNEDLPSRGKTLYSRSEDTPVETESEPEPFDPLDEMGILPPPDFIRPMPGQRLVPRGEPNALRRMTSSPIGNTQIGRARARAAARLNESISEVLESDWQTTTDCDEEQSSPVDLSSFYNETSQEFNVITDPEEQHEFIAVASAPAGDNAAIAEWTNYIKSYSSGYFNISKPPAPPPRSVHFEYLPAVYPHDEESRITKHYSIDAPWTPELGGKTIALMGAAAKRFRLSCAAVSAFDEWHEILRVEDWRFAGNPWVTGSPHIRLFAAAPLISDSGEIMGVFSIHSKQPRSEFSRVDRRELAEFAALSVKDICLHGERHYRSVSAESALPNDNSPEAFRQYLTPTRSQNFPGAVDPDSRPYSTSDLTSVDMPQNNTPNDTFYSDDSYSHYQLDLDGPTTPKQPRFVFPNTVYRNLGPSTSGISLNNSFGRLYMEGDSMAGSNYHQELLEPDVARRSTSLTRPFSTISSNSMRTSFSSKIGGPNQGDENTTSSAPRSNIAEAAFSCSFSGRQFGFDQTYAVQVDCPYPGMSDRDLLGPHGLNLKILASYGLPYGYESELNRNLSLKTAFLKGLRTNEFCHIWAQDETSETHRQEGSLDFGVLMPLCPLSQTRSRDHGIVYAMFKKVNLSSHNNLQRTDVDLHGLRCAANSMTILLFNLEIGDVETQSFAKQKVQRQGTPTIIGATEVGRIYYSRRPPSAYSRHSSF